MVSLTFYGGVKEIGGNKILLEDDGTKIFLDFGMNFSQHAKFFTEYMPPRKNSCITDMMFLGLLPNIKGLYRRDYCKHQGADHKEENSVDGVLISHGHIDHVGYVHFLRKDIPVHVSHETKAIMELFTRTGAGGFSEFCDFKPSFELIPAKTGGMKRRDARDGTEKRDVRTFEFGKKFTIGNLEIEPYRVDHSLPGATGFIIHTSAGAIIYTGDLRFHGRHRDWSNAFVSASAAAEPVAMISEGTRIKKSDNRTEDYVQKESTDCIKGKKGLAIANFPIRDTERLLTFYQTAKANQRKLVIEYRQAILLDLLKKCGIDGLPDSKDPEIRIFYPKKSWGLIGRKDFDREQVERDYTSWERTYASSENVIDACEIRDHQNGFVMFMNYFQLNNLLDLKPVSGSVHIRSICEPFCEDMELDQKRINNWLRLFKLYPEKKFHCSGHATGDAIEGMIKTVSPKAVFPIHTEYPGIFRRFNKSRMVKYGKCYEI
ncbi:MAG: MBL fold metallo-hydrolase [Candidatus Aenigmatarchaeota archaeon]